MSNSMKPSEPIKFSILIPNLGYNKYLFECLDSVVSQKRDDSFVFEVIVCDQSEKDIYEKIENEIAKRYGVNSVKLLHSEQQSVTLARHRLVSCCACDYFYFVDSDDYLDLDCLSVLSKKILEKGCPDILITNYLKCSDNGVDFKRQETHNPITEKNVMDYFLYTNSINSLWRKIIKRKLYIETDYNDFSNRNGEDFIMSYPMMLRAKTIACDLDIYKYHYRQHKHSRISTLTIDDAIQTLFLRKKIGVDYSNLNSLQKSLRLKTLVSYFSDSSQKMIRSKAINKQTFIQYADKVLETIIDERLDVDNKLSKKEKILFGLLKRRHYSVLWFLLGIASKRV